MMSDSSDLGGDGLHGHMMGDVDSGEQDLVLNVGEMRVGEAADEGGGTTGGGGLGDLDRAMEGVDLTRLSEEEVADLESGDAGRMAAAIRAAQRPVGRDDDADDGGRLPGRISLRAIESREERRGLIEATRMLREGEAGTLKEALGRVFGMIPPCGNEIRMTNGRGRGLEGDLGADGGPRSGERGYEGEYEELRREMEARRAEYDFEGADEVMAEMLALQAEAQKGAVMREAEVAAFKVTEDAARERVVTRYGDLMAAKDGVFNFLLDAEIALAERVDDDILYHPDWPEKIADRTYAKHGALMGGGTADPERGLSGERTPPAPRMGVRMPGSPVGGGANSMALTASAALTEFERLDPDEQRRVLDRLDRTRL